MAAGNNSLWKSVCAVVGREDLFQNERFVNTTDRAVNQDALREILENIFISEEADTWLTRFREAGVPCAPINNYSDVLADPQVDHMEWVQALELPNGSVTRTFVSPVRFDSRTTGILRRPPELGEHKQEVLAELQQARMTERVGNE
jgi:crotonobetainyl-CoA:carnitine CoA-transferase CaiB-like acyl-CoA transferase